MATSNLGYQSFYQAQLTSAISDTDLTIPLDVVPTPSEGFLVIESTSSTKREIIYYTSKTSNSVVCPSGGRGYDGTTAQSHLQNSAVIMAPVAAMFSSMRDLFETTPQGWTPVTQTVSSVTYNGQRSYSLTTSASILSTLSLGMRVRTTRTVSAPTQCTSLNGTTQYYSRASASLTGMTFTDDFTVSAWVKVSSYQAGVIVGRYNGTSGWYLIMTASGILQIVGHNAGAGNFRLGQTFQSVPLNKWVHITGFLDMSGYSYTTDNGATGSYIMIDGVVVPGSMSQGGTNPTSLLQAGDLQIGAVNGAGTFFPGKIAQVAVFNARITPTTIRSYYSQGLSGTETSLISAYSFNGNANDLNTTNANNLTANGSAVATEADSPFGKNSFGAINSTQDFGIITGITSSTQITVQVPEGCTIPTSGGVTSWHYSTQKVPYNFPANTDRWEIQSRYATAYIGAGANNTRYNPSDARLSVPVGYWNLGFKSARMRAAATATASSFIEAQGILSTSAASAGSTDEQYRWYVNAAVDFYATGSVPVVVASPVEKYSVIDLSSTTIYYANFYQNSGATYLNASNGFLNLAITAIPASL